MKIFNTAGMRQTDDTQPDCHVTVITLRYAGRLTFAILAPRRAAPMSDFDLFAMETLAADASRQVLANPHASAADYRQALGALLTHFERLVRETRCMISQSDRREAEMNQLNARLGELARRLQYEASHDALTGALNRAAITHRAEHTLGAVILLDIDHFKRINDHYGHPCGDATLIELSRRVLAALPEEAMFGRLGGEEFLVICPGMHLGEAAIQAETLREHIAGQAFIDGGHELHVTISAGVAVLMADAHEAYQRADAALYRAKSHGRNRVEVAR